eukprot:CAMPEP_0170167390 /NCGR_PEP_ID=MMETSP0040_2-20121228/806_1 /TAXON_ID=641309 /ORGANISM="Lotharella oceanica, Strain CCMP622" /LENGTH=70 /DNA_ID=CAMNT_0010405389 /DNA_START=24 /DNA_END=233 /DNA_ORIENTATION=+
MDVEKPAADAKKGGADVVKFKVKKWNAVALWSWDITVDTCAICRNHIMSPCIECQAKDESAGKIDCPVAW